MNCSKKNLTPARQSGGAIVGLLAIFVLALVTLTAHAQDDIRLRYTRPAPLRFTVSVNTTNTGTFTNLVNLSTNIVGGVTLSVSNLPAGCGYTLATNGGAVAGSSVNITNDTGLTITVSTTNLAEGEYTFYLNGTGGATNSFPLMLQAAYIWQGTNVASAQFNAAYSWTNNSSWVGGNNPGLTSSHDVFFGDLGGQTNRTTDGITFTNINIDQDIAVGSVRFGPGTYTNLNILATNITSSTLIDTNLHTTNITFTTNFLVIGATNSLYHHVKIAGGKTLTVTGTKGFTILRDYIAEYGGGANDGSDSGKPDRKTGISFSGGNTARLVLSNSAANLSVLLDNGSQSGDSFLTMSNLGIFSAQVNRMGFGDYQLYPNYRAMNQDTNGLGAVPRRFVTTVYLARTNAIIAGYKDPDNYTNDYTRGYAIMWLNGETSGNGSSVNNNFFLGGTNLISADSVCFVGANHASGNGGFARFRPDINNCAAIFRGTNGAAINIGGTNRVGNNRMSIFTVSDGGGTNDAGSNIKANVDLATSGGTPWLDILADRFYIARDRASISVSNTVNYQGNVTLGRGIVDVNTAILGFQEHVVSNTSSGIQLGYCQANLTVTNSGTFKVNGLLTLGYTADTNSLSIAQQYNTFGRLTVVGATVIASNIVVDGGPRNYSHTEGFDRQDFIKLTTANLTVTNTIGGAPGQPLNSFSMERSTNVIFVNPSRTNLICRQLATPGTDASVIKVAGISGVGPLPATVPIISYEVASSPYLKADMSLTPGTNGYLLNNTLGSSIDLFLTTNASRTLLWTGVSSGDWDTNTANWIPIGGGAATKFTIGDVAVFDDTSTRTNVNIVDSVVPGQSGAGVLVSNYTRAYTFTGGTVAGTSLLLKVGTNSLTIGATKQGPLTILEGSLEVSVGGVVGLTTVASNTFVNCLGTINGGLSSTGAVVIATSGGIAGDCKFQGGYIANSGFISTAPGALAVNNSLITNAATGIMSVSGGAWLLPTNSVLANQGSITNVSGRINIAGLVFGNGTFVDPDGGINGGTGAFAGIDGRVAVLGPNGLLSPGATPNNSIGTMTISTRFDLFAGNNADNAGFGTYLCEVDKSQAQTSDLLAIDFWDTVNGGIIMSNINPAMPFANGDVFQVYSNNNGIGVANVPDVDNVYPTITPYVPGPGLRWNLSSYMPYGQIAITNSLMKWTGASSVWDTNTANWQPGTYADGQGALFDDSATSKTVNLTNLVLYPVGDRFTTNVVTGVSTNTVTNILSMMPGIVISNASDYFFTGSGDIDGWCSLYKTGPGTLTFGPMTNRYTGPTIIDQGVVVVTLFTNGGSASPLGSPANGPRTPKQAERFLLGNATLRFAGNTMFSDRGITLTSPNSTLEVSNSATTLTLNGVLAGFGQLNKTGPGILALQNSGSWVTNIVVNNGVLRLAPATAGQSPAAGGQVIVNGGSLSFTNSPSITNLINLAVSTAIDNTNATVLGGSFTGVGSVTVSNFAPSLLAWTRDLTNYTGTLTFVGNGTNRFNNATNSDKALGSPNAVFDLGASARLENFNGGSTNGGGSPLAYDLGGLAGGAGSSLAGRATNNGVANGVSIYNIGAKGVDTSFAGTILDGVSGGTVSVVKVGAAKLALNGINTYSGTTTVSNGTLGGTGSVVSAVIVVPGGTIAPGNSIGTFTVSNTVTLGGTALMELNGTTSDLLKATGTITAGGVLTVTNTGGTLVNGTVFTLFNPPVTGSFTATNLPSGYTWAVNLGTSGSITVLTGGTGGVNTTPTNITSSVVGTTLTLSWPSDHIGWTLQTQTNALSVGLTPATNTWFSVAGSSTTNSVSTTIDSTKPTVFYRLTYP